MSAQKGRDLLLKVQSGADFQTVAGLRATTLSFNAESVDATSQESGAWRELLAGAGLRSASLRGQGIFKDAASDATVRQLFFDGAIVPWRVILPDFGVIEGPFQVTALDYGARHDAEVTFELALASAGPLSFTVL
ncbi:phage major tail protein, TP901-1 family [Aestuariivirga sp.]|uniref:phage major tail protein, TP901-1 family n=1 Tax=Aestuariivirga sp. TaxID=2650926 RepID=UPI0039E26613